MKARICPALALSVAAGLLSCTAPPRESLAYAQGTNAAPGGTVPAAVAVEAQPLAANIQRVNWPPFNDCSHA